MTMIQTYGISLLLQELDLVQLVNHHCVRVTFESPSETTLTRY